jgi:phage tail protein X
VTTASLSPLPPSRTGWRLGGKRAQARLDPAFLDWALADFSGYVAADELYDGPFCILSAVDNRCYKRLLYEVLDHDPDHDDIRAFLQRLQAALTARDLTLLGVTTDGSALYPTPLAEVFGDVPHQICTFHIMAEVGKAVLGAVASARKGLAATQPKLRRGRPSTPAAKQAARTKKRLEAQRAALFTHRYLFVQRHVSKTERKMLWRLTRGLPHVYVLRVLMEQVYTLFDRRCRTQTALDKLDKLRCRLLRFPQVGKTLKKLFAPTLEKALPFLDDKLLPSTSNAVERGNRRYRKRQKSVYRVRTQEQISARLALDMWREAQAEGRQQTLAVLHLARAG